MKSSTWWIIGGALSVLASFFAFAKPFGATLTAELLAGWGFLFVGILQLISIFTVEGAGNKILALLWGALSTWLGISLLQNPLAGILSLTLAVGIMFLAMGIARLFFAFSVRGSGAFAALIFSAMISMLLGGMVLYYYPGGTPWFLGTLLAVELLFNGIGMIMLGATGKRIDKALSA